MRHGLIILVLSCLVVSGFAAITNVTKITELSQDSVMEAVPCVTDDELAIYFCRVTDLVNWSTNETFVEATRTSTSDPFGNITVAPFVNVMSDDREDNPWVSNDRLHLYFASSRDGTYDIFFASRSSTGNPFSAPTKLTMVSDNSAEDKYPRPANGELTIYFESNRLSPNNSRIYRATRPNLSSPFGVPTRIDEICGGYYLIDVSEDELTLVLYKGFDFYHSQRSSTSEPFPAPIFLGSTSSGWPTGGSLSGDLSKIYFDILSTLIIFSDMDLYVGDTDFAPPPPPTPTPTPVLPSPVPEIAMAANRDQITNFTGNTANPWAGAFDSQGRFVFFDQKAPLGASSPIGANQLIKMVPSGSNPSFTTLATQSQLASVNPRWSETGTWPTVTDVEMLSDDSIVLACLSYGYNESQLYRIVPGNPSQITVITSMTLPFAYPVITVDKSVNPDMIYIAVGDAIATIPADQINGTPSLWHTVFFPPAMIPINDIEIDLNGDVLYSTIAGGIGRIDKNTKAESYVLGYAQASNLTNFSYVYTFDVNPQTGDIIGVYVSDPPYTYTNSVFNMFKLTKSAGSSHTAKDYVIEEQIFGDADISPWYVPCSNFVLFGDGLDIDPTGTFLFCSCGIPDGYVFSSSISGINCVISVGAIAATKANPVLWTEYK